MDYIFGFFTPAERKKRRKAALYSMSEKVSTFFWDVAPQKGFEMRDGQQDMSFEIVDALINDQHFAVEAGVGIGKSFGYLVPLMLYSKTVGRPVIVATSTIALQEQLRRDIQDVMPLLGLNMNVILAKGQTHYLCRKKADEYMSKPDVSIPDALKEGIEKGLQDRKDFPETLSQSIWDKVNVQRFSKRSCGACEKKCLYYEIRSRLSYADGIILCNQDFLTSHLMKVRRGQDGLINRDADLIVVDEAHNLEDKVRSATTERVNQGFLLSLIRSAVNELKSSERSNVQRENQEAQKAIQSFFSCLKDQMQAQINESQQDMRYADRFFFDGHSKSISLLNEMMSAIKDLSTSIQIFASYDFQRSRSFSASDDLDAYSDSLSELCSSIDKMLIWIERKGTNAELVYCPKNTKDIISRLYFDGSERTILTSATLTNANHGSLEERYSYFLSNTGFPTNEHGCLSEPKPSPYPYDEHSMIYYCTDLPHPTREHDAFIEQGVERLIEVLNISEGKALVLFTAKTDMEEVHTILTQRNLPYKILMQQAGSSQDKVLHEFKENTNSVLLGTGAYWEGISIEGKSLSNVVIFRLPFPVPDPIIEYKASIADDALMEVRVPEMIIKLKQGIGRLIRNYTDTGIVCIIDRRLRDDPAERYHDITWDSLPIKNRTSDLNELRKFYEGLQAATE